MRRTCFSHINFAAAPMSFERVAFQHDGFGPLGHYGPRWPSRDLFRRRAHVDLRGISGLLVFCGICDDCSNCDNSSDGETIY